jgi:hypothetical protein
MYNHDMTKQKSTRRFSALFLLLGIVSLTIGIVTDQTDFTWIAIAFVVISMISSSKWFKHRR